MDDFTKAMRDLNEAAYKAVRAAKNEPRATQTLLKNLATKTDWYFEDAQMRSAREALK